MGGENQEATVVMVVFSTHTPTYSHTRTHGALTAYVAETTLILAPFRSAARVAYTQVACNPTDRASPISLEHFDFQVVTPVENIIAMYDEAWKYGKQT